MDEIEKALEEYYSNMKKFEDEIKKFYEKDIKYVSNKG